MKTLFIILLVISFFSFNYPSDKKRIVTDYYQAMNSSDFEEVTHLHYDSVRIKEGIYEMVYSIQDYQNWFQWDSVFHPVYVIQEINEFKETIQLTISKRGLRTGFLQDTTVVTQEIFSFKEGKIFQIEVKNYLLYDDEKWNNRKTAIVNFIHENNTELDGFIHDQSKQGALNYLKAISLFGKSIETTNQ